MKILSKNLLILASAGSGKTFQLGNRVIGLVASGIEPEKIVALTFTRKAAGEFADSVLTKLADAAENEKSAAALRLAIDNDSADFHEALAKVIRSLPKFTLGTMDGFFSKIVRAFQYELGLTGGKFDLLEGPRAEAAADELLADLLGESLDAETGEEFLRAFRRASLGKEGQRVGEGLREFVREWQGRYRRYHSSAWGPPALAGVNLEEWEKQKKPLADKIRRKLADIDFTDKRQQPALEKLITTLEQHTIGSGSLNSAGSLFASLIEQAADPHGPLEVRFHKDFIIAGPTGDTLRTMVNLAAHCEMAAATIRTRAVREVVAVYDAQCSSRLRKLGKLSFDDVKLLMGEWVTSEDARLRREAVDFRLDARYEHWLLDEFQDTSRTDWLGLLPLIDEAAGAGPGSMFVVGDKKQAIYAWRGGEVDLFDEIIERYKGGLEIEPMAESWRSCPEVLSLVNAVCGNQETMRDLFGTAASKWDWQDHFPAAHLKQPQNRGEARVEVVDGKEEERFERMATILGELEIGKRSLSCGVLLRSNTKVREVADHLRAAGFDVIEEGRREPARDNPVGITLSQLLNWLADPADGFAAEVLEMSPLANLLRQRFGPHWQQVWEGLTARAAAIGFAGMIEEVVEMKWQDLSEFGRRRAGDIIAALANLDSQGSVTPREAASWIDRLEVSQNPGAAAVQVMTIHKSKGLGFDVVILPDLPNDAIPSAQYFTVAEGENWLSQTPPKWARNLLPEMREAEEHWAMEQRYEAFCTLYVALTRAKRGLYVLLEPPSPSQEATKPSLANWLAQAIDSDGSPGIVYQSGSPDWWNLMGNLPPKESSTSLPPLGPATLRRHHFTPASGKETTTSFITSQKAMERGKALHAALEQISWLDENEPLFVNADIARGIGKIIESPEIRNLFQRKGRSIELHREQPLDSIINGKWMSGVIDRLHLHRNDLGQVIHVEIIDFKTDVVISMESLIDRHQAQMTAYHQAIAQIYPAALIDCLLVSLHRLEVTKL